MLHSRYNKVYCIRAKKVKGMHFRHNLAENDLSHGNLFLFSNIRWL